MAIQYLDFDLLIERSGNQYRARVLDSPAGEASGDFAVPFTPEDINNFFVQIGQTRSFETQQTRRIREFGQSLFEAVFTGSVRDRLRSSMGEANLHSNGLRIRLRLSGTPELGNLPWEFLYDPGANRFLALSVETPVVRYLETQQMAQPFAVQPPLRILTMICGPQDYPRLDTEREWENLQASMQGLQARGLVDLQRLEPPTLSALQQQLRRDQYHIFHFVGHGVFSKNEQDGYLLFENAMRGGQRISGHDLGTILHDHRPLRLAVLNACEGARASTEDQFAGTAQSLIQQGIPAVIAMQFRITDQASIMLAYEFYGALADGYPVDAALTEARKAIKTEGNDLEWGTPVLYMRTPDGRIFDIASQPAAVRSRPSAPLEDTEKTARLDRLYTEGLEAFYLGQWETASEKFGMIVDSRPDYRDASVKLDTVKRRLTLQSLDTRASEAENAGKWNVAAETLEQLSAEDPAFPGIGARLATARKQFQLAELLDEAAHLAEAEKWEAVLGIFKEMEKLDPRPPDPSGLRSKAEQTIAKNKRDRELEISYSSALQALDLGDSGAALRHLRRVRQLQPGYRETDRLLRRLEEEAKGASKAKKEKPVRARTEVGPEVTAPSNAMDFEWGPPALFGIFMVGSLVLGLFDLIVKNFLSDLPLGIRVFLGWLPGGILTGLIFWWFLSRAIGPLSTGEKYQVLGASAIGQLIIGFFVGDSTLPEGQWYLLCTVYGALLGAVITGILRARGEITQQRQSIMTIAAWGLAYGLSALFGVSLGWELNWKGVFSEDFLFASLGPILLSFGAFLGGWITLAQLKANRTRSVGWKTVLVGALGFAIGYVVFLFLRDAGMPSAVQGLVLGAIGGAALSFPSKNLQRYIISAAAVGIPVAVGGSLFSEDIYVLLFSGTFAGLSLGLVTKQASGVVSTLILSILAFGLGFAFAFGPYVLINSLRDEMEVPVQVLAFGLLGALLAAGWDYLKDSGKAPSEAH